MTKLIKDDVIAIFVTLLLLVGVASWFLQSNRERNDYLYGQCKDAIYNAYEYQGNKDYGVVNEIGYCFARVYGDESQ